MPRYNVGNYVIIRHGLDPNENIEGVGVGIVSGYGGRTAEITEVFPDGSYYARPSGTETSLTLTDGMIERSADPVVHPTTQEQVSAGLGTLFGDGPGVPQNGDGEAEVEVNETHRRNTMNFHFVNEEEAISFEDVKKFVHYFKTQLRIGVELEKDNSRGRSRELATALRPTHDYNRMGAFGVYDIVPDGSLSQNGQEVLVIGANEEFSSWHRKMKAIHEILKEHGYHETQKCGMHYHLLTVQQETIPEVIIKNLYQLVRYFSDALVWMGSCQRGAGKNRGLSQWSKFHPMMTKSPVGRTIRELQQELGDRYMAFNICGRGFHAQHRGETGFLRFDGNAVQGLHVEFRWPDGSDSPAHIVALGNLFRALVLKAVELSEFGIVHVDHDRREWQTLKERITRMSGGYAMNEADQEICKAKAKQLTKTVRNQLLSFDGSSIAVLEKIGETPPSALKNLGRSWAKIENYYYPEYMQETDANSELRKAIIRQKVVGCKNKRDWEVAMAKELGLGSFETLRDRMDALKKKGANLYFDKDVGAYLWVF